MPAREGQGSRDTGQSNKKALLKIPLQRAKAELEERINAGRKLAPSHVPRDYPELDALLNQISYWREYNQTWLDRNLGGEAAQDYKTASQHLVSATADDPATRLVHLSRDIAQEIAKLESIRGRLPLWSADGDTANIKGDGVEQSPANRGAAAHHGTTEPATDFAANRKAVMVIYGHDQEANDALFDWLRAIGLEPREWTQLVQATGSGSPYIGQILDQAFTQAQAVVALFTPDEHVIPRTADTADLNAWRLQARPNVLIEAGMALVTHPTRTVLVTLGDLELPSDLAGRHYTRLSHIDARPLHDLASRLHAAGCDTNTTGTQWLNPARFPDRTLSARLRAAQPAVTPSEHTKLPASDNTMTRDRAAEERARQDTQARQVVVTIEHVANLAAQVNEGFTHLTTVTTPSTYPIKQVEGQIAWQTTNGGLAMTSLGYADDPPRPANGHISYTFRASINPQIRNPEPITRFVDQHGNRYYQFRIYTQRFPANTDWTKAAQEIDQWLRTGPNPD